MGWKLWVGARVPPASLDLGKTPGAPFFAVITNVHVSFFPIAIPKEPGAVGD